MYDGSKTVINSYKKDVKTIKISLKSLKIYIFGHLGSKNGIDKKFSRIPLIEIDSKWSKTHFRMKIIISKNSPLMICFRDSRFSSRYWVYWSKKMVTTKN